MTRKVSESYERKQLLDALKWEPTPRRDRKAKDRALEASVRELTGEEERMRVLRAASAPLPKEGE